MAIATMTEKSTKCPTAAELNRALESGGMVQVATPLRSTLYKQKHAGMFVERDGSLYVQRGKHLDKLSMGDHPLVAIRVVRSERELRPATVVEHPSGTGFAVNVGKQGTNTRWISGGAGPFGGGDIGRWPTKEAATKEAERLGYEVAAAPQPKVPKGELIAKYTERKMSASTGIEGNYVYEYRLVEKPQDAGPEWMGNRWGIYRTLTVDGEIRPAVSGLLETADSKEKVIRLLPRESTYDKAEKYGLAKAHDEQRAKEKAAKEATEKAEHERERQAEERYSQRMKELGTRKGVKRGIISIVSPEGQRKDVPGLQVGHGIGVAIHGKELDGGGKYKSYVVTHLNTGKAMGGSWKSSTEAVALAKAIAEMGDWSQYKDEKDVPKTMMREAVALVRGFTGKKLEPAKAKAEPKAEAPKPTTEAKEPWKMRSHEYVKANTPVYDSLAHKLEWHDKHEALVKKALSEGKPVPAEVLKDYPELGKKETKVAEVPPPSRGASIEGLKSTLSLAVNQAEQVRDSLTLPKEDRPLGAIGAIANAKGSLKADLTEAQLRHHIFEVNNAIGSLQRAEARYKPPKPEPKAEGKGKEYTPVDKLPDNELWRLYKIPEHRDMPQDYKNYLGQARKEFDKRKVKLGSSLSAKPSDYPEIGVKPLPQEGFIISRGKEVPIAYDIEGKKWKAAAVLAPTRGRLAETHYDIYFNHFKVGTGKEITKAHIDKGIALAKAHTLPRGKPEPKAKAKPKKEPKPHTQTLREIAASKVAQSERAIAIDRALLAKQVVSVDDPRWLKRPNRFDVRGIDTPGSGRVVSRTGFTDKGKTRMSRRHHRGWKRIKL